MAIPLISVIVPVHNVERYLRQCLDSLVAQTLKEIEFLLVNDGSTDGSPEILREYANKYPQFKLIEQENKGYAGARNAAFPAAAGEYLGFVDSDDWVAPEMFEKLLAAAQKNDADIAACSFWYYYEQNRTTVACDVSAQIKILEKSGGELSGAETLLFDTGVTWNRIYRRSMMENYRIRYIEKMEMAEDVCVFLEALCIAKKIVIIPDRLYYYRNQRPGQQISFSDRRLFSFFTIFEIFNAFVKKHGLEYLEPWILHLRLSRYCYGYENIADTLKDEYFQTIRKSLLADGISLQAQIAPGCMRYGGLRHRLRYLILYFLHPLTLKAILKGKQKQFDRIIALRLFLLNLPRHLAGMFNLKYNNPGCFL